MSRASNKTPEIKICGITDIRETEYLNEYRVDYAGFVFYPASKRNITIHQAKQIANELDPEIKKVAVLVSPDAGQIEAIQEAGFADILQIHKDIDIRALRAADLPVWRAVNISTMQNIEEAAYVTDMDAVRLTTGITDTDADLIKDKITAIVADAPDFGSGKTFDWSDGKINIKSHLKFILAGGLNASNVTEGIRIFHPDTVDVSSGVEGDHGKSKDKIAEFVKAVRSFEHQEGQ
ncbi:MAG: phosphoribosylanthranilate isomerase [Lachnospiraceae bacterium]|nr:phosphoribosylanthranilate isomerase [Lachnospiraceae bacterium]